MHIESKRCRRLFAKSLLAERPGPRSDDTLEEPEPLQIGRKLAARGAEHQNVAVLYGMTVASIEPVEERPAAVRLGVEDEPRDPFVAGTASAPLGKQCRQRATEKVIRTAFNRVRTRSTTIRALARRARRLPPDPSRDSRTSARRDARRNAPRRRTALAAVQVMH